MSPNEIHNLVRTLLIEIDWNGALNIVGDNGVFNVSQHVTAFQKVGAAEHAAILKRAHRLTRDDFEEAWFACTAENVRALLDKYSIAFHDQIAHDYLDAPIELRYHSSLEVEICDFGKLFWKSSVALVNDFRFEEAKVGAYSEHTEYATITVSCSCRLLLPNGVDLCVMIVGRDKFHTILWASTLSAHEHLANPKRLSQSMIVPAKFLSQTTRALVRVTEGGTQDRSCAAPLPLPSKSDRDA